jgi:predicted  nucleic acid-binding Zn-ribbon protein
MGGKSYPHETIAWAKQRLDELDAIIFEVEKASKDLSGSVRAEADDARARLEASRTSLRKSYEGLRAEAEDLKHTAEDLQDDLDAEWVEVETSFQSFLGALTDQADTVRSIVAARVEAQRQAWDNSLKGLRDQAAETVDNARGELDAAIKHLSDEADKFQARIGEVKDAGDTSWEAVKNGLAEAKAVHDRTIVKIKGAFAKLF